jgi:hypothetical protein
MGRYLGGGVACSLLARLPNFLTPAGFFWIHLPSYKARLNGSALYFPH